jgi:hypothetical protein
MADQTIAIPDMCPPEVDLDIGDKLTINFHQTVFLWNSNPDEFTPRLEVGIYRKGDQWVVTANTPGTVIYGWLALVADSEACVGEVEEGRVDQGGSGGHTIQVGGGPGSSDLSELRGILKSHSGLCEYWPGVAQLIELLLRKPHSRDVEAFLEALLDAGNAVCPKLK